MTGRFGEADVARNDGLEELFAEEVAEVLGDLLGEVGAVVVHGQQDALDGDVGIEGGAYAFERGDELGDAFKGKVLGLHGDDEGVGCGEDVEGEEVEGRGAIEDDEVILVLDGLRGLAEAESAVVGVTSSMLAPVRFLSREEGSRDCRFRWAG